MKIQRIKLQDICGLNTELDLESFAPGMICLTGANGAGKSTIAEALLYALYGGFETKSGHARTFITGDSPMCEVAFCHNNHSYVARMQPSETGRTEAYLWQDGAKAALNEGAKVSDYLAHVNRLFGSKRLLTSAMYSCWGGAGNVFSMPRADRRDLFAETLDIAGHQRISDAGKAKANSLQDELDALAIKAGKLEAQLESLGKPDDQIGVEVLAIQAAVAGLEAQQAAYRTAVDGLTESVNREREAESVRNEYRARLAAIEQQLAAIAREQDTELPQRLARAEQARDGAVSEAEAEASKIEEYREAERSRLVAIDDIEQIKERIAGCRSRIARLNDRVAIADEIEAARLDYVRKAEHPILGHDHGELLVAATRLGDLRSEWLSVKAQKRELEDRLTKIKLAVSALYADSRRLEECRAALSSIQVPCQELLDPGALRAMTEQCPLLVAARDGLKEGDTAESLEAEIEVLSSSVAGIGGLERDLSTTEADIAVAADRLNSIHSESEGLAGSDEALKSYRDAKSARETANDEYHRILDEHKHDCWETAAADLVDEKEARYHYELALSQATTELGRYIAEAAKLPAALRAEERIANARATYEQRLDEITGEAARLSAEAINLRNQSNEIPAEVELGEHDTENRLEYLLEQLRDAEDELTSVGLTLTDKTAALARAKEREATEQRLDAKRSEVLEDLAAARKSIEDSHADEREWRTLQLAFGRTGVQAMELDAASVDLSAGINSLLEDWGVYSVRLVTQQPLAKGDGYKEVFDLELIDSRSGKIHDESNPSAGQQAILCEAVAGGVSRWVQDRYGFHAGTLVRDEATATLREDAIDVYLRLLRKAAASVGAGHVLYVAHQPEVIAAADVVLLVEDGKVRRV